ncbi:hypothetical protein IV102_02590 [bacterium]|nr:hypothetical protein [bacterium]
MRKYETGLTAVALVLTVGASFMLMTAGAGDSVILGLKHASRASFMSRTHYAAYGAMQSSLDKLNLDYNYACDDIGNKTPVENDPDLVSGVSIYNNSAGASSTVAPDGATIPPKMSYIKVEADFKEYPGKFKTTFTSRAYIGSFQSDTMILASQNIALSNTTVDSSGVSDKNIYYPSLKSARIITNSISPNSILIQGDAAPEVKANLRWGPGGDEATCVNIVAPAFLTTGMSKAALTFPARVARFRPFANPKYASDDGAADDRILTANGSLPKGQYRNFSATNCNVTLESGQYYVANDINFTNANITIPGVTAANHCALYVGRNINITNSTVNWDNIVTSAAQKELGPRTLYVYFVGSGRPRTYDNTLTISQNSQVSLHAAGKAMTVNVTNSSVWGGFKGYQFFAESSNLHYHRALLQPPLMASHDQIRLAAERRNQLLGALALFRPALFSAAATAPIVFNTYPQQQNPFSAWSLEGMADDEAEGAEAGDTYDGGYGY